MKNFKTKLSLLALIILVVAALFKFFSFWQEEFEKSKFKYSPPSQQELEFIIQKQRPYLIDDLPFSDVEAFFKSRNFSLPPPSVFKTLNSISYSKSEEPIDNISLVTFIDSSATPPNPLIKISFTYIIRNDGEPVPPEYLTKDMIEYFDMLLELPIRNIPPETTKKWLREKLPLLTDESSEFITIDGITYELSLSLFSSGVGNKITLGKSYRLKVYKNLDL